MQKLFLFALLGCKASTGLAVPWNLIHSQHVPEDGVLPSHFNGEAMTGHLHTRADSVNYTEAYNQLMKLLHEIYGEDIGKVLQDPEWLTRVCSQVCAPDDRNCREACSAKGIGYLDVDHIARCAAECEHIPHFMGTSLQDEDDYANCLIPCLENKNEYRGRVKPLKETPSPIVSRPTQVTKPNIKQDIVQDFPYSVTLMDATSTTVVEVVSRVTPALEDLSTVDENTRFLEPIVKGPNLEDNTPEFTRPTQNTKYYLGSTKYDDNETASDPDMADLDTLMSLLDSDTTIIEDNDSFIVSDADSEQYDYDYVPTPAVGENSTEPITAAPIPEVTIVTDDSGALITSMVGVLDDLQVSIPGVIVTIASINFTNMTTSRTTSTTLTPTTTSDLDLAEGAASVETPFPFLSFGSSTTVLFAFVIGFGLIMG